MKKSLICLIISIFLLLPIISATTINAPSCSQTDVQAAVNAAQDGDTILVPVGACTWTTVVTIDLYSPAKALTIKGAGIGLTNITDYGFDVKGGDGKPWRINGMTMKGSAGFFVEGASKNWRIDYIYFDHVTGKASASNRIIWVQASGTPSDYNSGVIDHCTFDNANNIVNIHVRDVRGGNTVWNRPLGLGGSDAVYIEDCNFIHVPMALSDVDCESGSYVFRHNTVRNGNLGMHDAIIGGLRGCKKWEIYDNLFINDPGTGLCGNFGLRGGNGVVFNNVAQGRPDCNDGIWIQTYRTTQLGGDPWDVLCGSSSGIKACLGSDNTYPRRCTSDADCGGITGSCIDIDNSSNPTGYPCRDQLGWEGNLIRTLRPVLFWNNTIDGAYAVPVVVRGPEYVMNGREYCYGPTMPTSCGGVATTYVPYPYPHPLSVAQFGTDICGEGEITKECWCEGLKSVGYCYHGYYYSEEGERIIPPPAEEEQPPLGEIVTIQNMLNAYQRYKRNEVSILYFLDKLRNWIIFR